MTEAENGRPSKLGKEHSQYLEDNRPGYPQFTRLLAANPRWLIFRIFAVPRIRLLLIKQDKVVRLEQQLAEIDQNEEKSLYLGSIRHDQNPERKSTLLELEGALAEYDQVMGKGHLARVETAYVEGNGDLVSLAPEMDSAVLQLSTWVENLFIQFWPGSPSRNHDFSINRNLYIYQPSIQRMANMIFISSITLLLMVPFIMLGSSVIRILIATPIVGLYLMGISSLIKGRTIERIIAGTVYALALVMASSSTPTIRS